MKKADLLITTGNYKPDIGGPATFLKGFEKYLLKNKIKYILIAVVNQNEIVNKENNIILISRRIPFFIRTIFTTALFIYFRFKCKYWLSNTLEIETIITKLVTFQSVTGRIVGDRAWETAVNRGLTEANINDFQNIRNDFKIYMLKFLRNFHHLILDRSIVPSQYMKRLTSKWSRTKISLIYNGIEDKSKKTARNFHSCENLKFVCVSRLVKWKGLDELILIFRNIEWAELVIIGDGPELESLIKLKKKNSVSNIKILGQKTLKQVHEILEQSDVFILNSYYEGLSHALLEASMYSLPMIVRNSGGNSEVVINNQNGFLYNKSEQILYLIEKIRDKKLREKFSINSRMIYEEKFNNLNTYSKYIEQIKK